MKILYEIGDVVLFVERGTRHRVCSQFQVQDQVLGSEGAYQYLSLDPPGPRDVFDSTDARRVIPVVSGFLYYHGQQPAVVSCALQTLEGVELQAASLRSRGYSVYSLPVHLDVSPDAAVSFRMLAPTWFK